METTRVEHFLTALGRTSLEAAVVVALVVAAQWLFGRRLAARWRCALWLLVAVRLLLPVSFGSATSVFNFLPKWSAQKPAPTPIEIAPSPAPTASVKPAHLGATPDRDVSYASVRQRPTGVRRPYWVFAAWVVGLGVVGGNVVAASLRFRKRCADPQPVGSTEAAAVMADCCERLRVRNAPLVCESDVVKSPALYGLFRPRLLLPCDFAHRFSTTELRFVFLHELAHLKRRDLAVNWVTVGLQAVHWFNPLVWFAFARWRADRELACDAMVLEAAGPDQSRDYGRTILRLLESATEPVATPGVVGILEEKKQLRRRIEMITAHISVKGWPRLAVVLTAALAVIGLTDAKNSNNEKGNMKIGNSIVHAGVIGMLALSTPAPAAPTVAQDMIGTWVLVGKPGKVGKAPSSGGRYKFFTGDRWCITEADPDNGVVIFHHGGTYKFDGEDYVESLEYANPTTMDRIGNTHRYKLSVEKGMLTQTGIDRPDFAEVWKRVPSKSGVERSALGTGLQGTWLLTKQDGKDTSDGLRAYKMITDSSWCDTSYWGKNDVVIYHHGGVFTLKDNRLVEHVVYANPSSMGIIGNASKFDIALDGDTLKMTGIGNPWNEVWERVK